ncbi:acyltransferase (plasmid) [Roseobacter ponti]|uniref:Acyltransferase n=1 Tax=Roseobacter ponti TaxID=1891787 RepID=A0A858SXF4_9RHOB|nr:acyltransferase [Roseobacter ponti]
MRPEAALHNVNTLRYFATALLVAFHVVGASETGGMQVGYPSVWRMFADGLIDVRMPLFAFIAGAVYALRPLLLSDISGFCTGKFYRIVLPGIAASVIFLVICNLVLKNGFAYGADPLSAVLLSMGHFWFLQAILIIFLVVGGLDALLRYRAAALLFAGAVGLTLVRSALPLPALQYLMIDGAVYLAPYFLLGMLLFRHHAWVAARKQIIVPVALGLFGIGLAMNIAFYQETGHLSQIRFDAQSLAQGIGIILLAQLLFPRVALLDRLAVFSFTIFLYHPFGTAAVSRSLTYLEVDALSLHFVLGLVAGLVVPCLIHLLAARSDWSRRLILGLRPIGSVPLNATRKTL